MADATSILNTTKAALGLAADYDVFDQEVLMHINSVMSTLTQLGVGPDEGYWVENATDEWADFLGDDRLLLNFAKSYMYICVQLLFDISTMPGPVIASKEKLKLEYEWRLQVAADPPLDPFADDDDEEMGIVLDGGAP